MSGATNWRAFARTALTPVRCDHALMDAIGVGPLYLRVAETLSHGDPALAEDLIQEGLIRLWEFDPTRIDRSSAGGRRLLRRVIVNRMRDVAQAHHTRR